VRTGEIVTASACQPYNWLTSGCGPKRSSELAQALTHCKTPNSATPRCQAERANALALARTHCKTADSTTPRCETEREREFAAARNAEINASIAAVASERARVLAQRLTHCDSPSSTSPRCEAERERQFAAARNAEINASVAAVAAERTRQFAAARNAEINASLAAVAAERTRQFAAARNAEINASIAAVNAARNTSLAFNLTHCKTPGSGTPRCKAERAGFAAARNVEINASIAAVAAERTRAFAAARNAEINASIAASQAQRALRQARSATAPSQLETGAISLPEAPVRLGPAPARNEVRYLGPCREAGRIMSPLQFTDGNAEIEQAMKPQLDSIAMMAKSCPAVRFEIHGHTDSAGPVQVKRHLAQRRAQAAVEYLAAAGIDRSRLVAIGHGDAEPVVPNTTADNRAANRRVVVAVKDPAMFAVAQRIMWDLAEALDPTYVPPLARLSP
jgi:outer membrane protein OmpA-like peptidoglycan-associated protein